MLLAEELVLLVMDDDTGACLVRHDAAREAVATALIFELVLREVVRREGQGVLVRTAGDGGPGAASTGDPILDLTADRIDGSRPADAVQHLVEDDLLDVILQRLVARGVLHDAELWSPGVHLPRDPDPEAAVRERVRSALVEGAEPTRHDAVLISLVHRLSLVPVVLPTSELQAAAVRAEKIAATARDLDEDHAATAATAATAPPSPPTSTSTSRARHPSDPERKEHQSNSSWRNSFDLLEVIVQALRAFS